MDEDLPYVVLDTGSYSLKYRFSHDETVLDFPAQIGYVKKPLVGDELKDSWYGHLSLFWPQRNGVLESIEGSKLLWESVFEQLDEALDTNGRRDTSLFDRCIYGTLPMGTDTKIIQEIYEIFLEKYRFSGCRMVGSSLMASMASPGPCLVVDLGLAAARTCVVVDSKPMAACVAPHLGAFAMTQNLRDHLTFRHPDADVWSWHRINDLLRQAKCHARSMPLLTPTTINWDEQTSSVLSPASVYAIGEQLFRPQTKDMCGLAAICREALKSFHEVEQEKILQNVQLCGGMAGIPGLAERLQHELGDDVVVHKGDAHTTLAGGARRRPKFIHKREWMERKRLKTPGFRTQG